jgi:sulfite exporter TauE/SafE
VDSRTRRTAGWAVVGLGVVVAVVGGLADQLGLGGDGPDEFGAKQVAAVVVGVVLIVAGLAVALRRPGQEKPNEPKVAPDPRGS